MTKKNSHQAQSLTVRFCKVTLGSFPSNLFCLFLSTLIMCCVNISFSVSKCPHCLHLKSIFFTCISVQKDVTPVVANKGNIQDETGSDDEEDDVESEREFKDGDDQFSGD